jgi:hypothetical protein
MTTLHGPIVASYISTLLETTGQGYARKTTFNALPIDPDDFRRIRAWAAGEYNVTLWKLDRLLVRYGLHVNDFFDWCEQDPWVGETPWFELEAA